MTEAARFNSELLCTTAGEIAVINLNSARLRSWRRFFQHPLVDGTAETVIEHEQIMAQFTGDLSALDRLESLMAQLAPIDGGSARAALIQAQVASMGHRFADARKYLAEAQRSGTLLESVRRLQLIIDQACGVNLENVLDQRRRIATKSGQLEDLLALGAVLADMRQFVDADRAYKQALREYRDVSPFAVAWVCFQLGMLWGELVPEPQVSLAVQWYRRAVDLLPSYVKARVHLAEIYLSCGRLSEAEALLVPAIASGDPEVRWRLADVMASQGRYADAQAEMEAARSVFESLLERHLLAFADHGAEFYARSGNDYRRALDLARVNVVNRPTLRAFEQAHEIAVSAGDGDAASELLMEATERWEGSIGFRLSSLAKCQLEKRA
jgi:tetratricopeptide (TPR) repeat protein